MRSCTLFCLALLSASACDTPVQFETGPRCDAPLENETYPDVISIARRDDGFEVSIPTRPNGLNGFALNREWIFTIISDVPPEGRIYVVLKTEKVGQRCVRNATFHVRWPSDIK